VKTALIGHTGFVGSNLARQFKFDDVYNSSSIHDIRDQEYDLIVCAGAPGFKWKANREPENDLRSIRSLIDNLSLVRAKRFVLISSADVYPEPRNVNELSVIDRENLSPYGAHRLLLEDFVRSHFSSLTVRLPGLFGKDLKKNALFDFLTGNETTKINPSGIFQFYDMSRAWRDIQIAMGADLDLLNMATEPVSIGEIHQTWFANQPTATANPESAARYDLRTLHGGLWHHQDGYVMSKAEVFEGLDKFIKTWSQSGGASK
jgi:hypothetical protein